MVKSRCIIRQTLLGLAALVVIAVGRLWADSEISEETLARNIEVSRSVAADGLVLLKNNGALPLKSGSRFALFDLSEKYRPGGGGSSNVRRHYSLVDIPTGLAHAGLVADDGNRETAVVVLGRHSTEGRDNVPEVFDLSAKERETFRKIKADGFRRIVVVCNCGHVINLRPLAEDPAISAILWAWFPGGEGGAVVGEVVAGKINPSGRLACTFAEKVSDWASDKGYSASRSYIPFEDDIFVGYRYFETIPGAKEKVVYPFGYGLSYTDFGLQTSDVRIGTDDLSLKVKVVNQGKLPGKRSVLCYTSQKGGKAEHPALELRAFAKTRLLQPGESETLTLSFPRRDLSYFDDEGASGSIGSWVVDEGRYTLWVGGSVRDVVPAGSFTVEKSEVVETPGFKLQPTMLARRLRADGTETKTPTTYPWFDGMEKNPNMDPKAVSPDKPAVTLFDVARGKATLDELLGQMTLKEMVSLLHGQKRSGASGEGAIGRLEKFGLVGVETAASSHGVLHSSKSTYFPCEALMASTFNPECLRIVGRAIGEETLEADYDVILGPALNIQRHPLCGRNFEYFSEDPLVTGVAAAEYVAGVQEKGVGTSIKHFAGDSREAYCKIALDVVSERAAREIYLRGYERAVKCSSPWTVMTAYNGLNGFNTSAHKGLVTGILRDEWGFDGLVTTDWSTSVPLWREVSAGNDVKMPTDGEWGMPSKMGIVQTAAGLQEGRSYLSIARVRESVRRVCQLVMKSPRFKRALSASAADSGKKDVRKSQECGTSGSSLPSLAFDTPAKDETGVMILGNGEVGATAWIGEDGTLHTVLQRTDSWNEGGQHVKVGAIDYETGANVEAGSFRQTLSLEDGTLDAEWRCDGRTISLHYRVQHGGEPFAVCDVRGARARAKVVNWRLWPEGTREMSGGGNELGNQFPAKLPGGKPTFTVNADRLVPGGWCHVNRRETVDRLMGLYDRYQATGDLGKPEFLQDRVFGGVTREYRMDDRTLFVSAITSLRPCKDADDWLRRTNALLDEKGWGLDGEAGKLAAHKAGWAEFWSRSHVAVTPSRVKGGGERPFFDYPYNPKIPVSYGHDSRGGTVFSGKLNVDPDTRVGPHGLVFKARFNTDNPKASQRLFDNVTPGKSDGSLVDIYQGKLRLVVGDKTFCHPRPVVGGRDVRVQVTVSLYGDIQMTLDGAKYNTSLAKAGVSGRSGIATAETCAAVTRAWAAQRYLTACASKGTLPNRFNGSLFTISHEGNPDYRRWGSGYWWQNTRLTHYPMFAAGDFDMLQPLFRMYVGLSGFNARRTKKYLGHGGAYFPECMQPWGDHFMDCYGMKDWEKRADRLQDSPWHKYEWVGQLELCLMLLDYRAYTLDDDYFVKTALPAIREYVRHFDEHYALDENGRYRMNPSQALETWWVCTNPMPEIAGLRRVTERLLALPEKLLSGSDRELFSRIRSRIPDLPTRALEDGRKVFAPADKFEKCPNCELPELYCVFPFRLCSFEKPNCELGRATYETRRQKLYMGWCQDELFAAYLGMAEEAQAHLVERVLTNSSNKYRWPTYWGPNYDWLPDQDAGGNVQNILQSMIMQCDGDRIYLAPAWPKTWNCSFRLNAPGRTVVEGRVEDGEVKDLVVTPASRRGDVVIVPKGEK